MQSEDIDMEDSDDDGDEHAYLSDDDDFGLSGAKDIQKLRHDVLQRFVPFLPAYMRSFLTFYAFLAISSTSLELDTALDSSRTTEMILASQYPTQSSAWPNPFLLKP